MKPHPAITETPHSRSQRELRFSQANKLCCRATPDQALWLAAHIESSRRSVSQVMRDALALYIHEQEGAASGDY